MSVKTERTGFEVAIIGMAGSFPGATNLTEFWDNLLAGKECITRFTDEELVAAGVSPELMKHPNYVPAKGVFPNAEYFDAEFFGYTPADASTMDPQVRLLHQGVYHALEDAGLGNTKNRNIGLFAGASGNFNWELDSFLQAAESSSGQFSTGQLNDKDFIATRLAYKLDLRGPAIAVHSACSTSLLSIDLACRHIYTGACGVAVAAGVGLTLPIKNGYGYEEGMIKSADGSCRAFADDANGTVEGNGMAAVVLKPLEEALEDGDSIYAIVRGIAVNNDGERKVGFTAPSVEGQVEVIRRALFMAEVKPETITYVEAHGTGTNLGDPVEVEALKQAFRSDKTGVCGIGSLKSNIGHTDVAAGISSFIKTTLALKHKTIPASINITLPNSKIEFEKSPFYLVTEKQDWSRLPCSAGEDYQLPLRAGVSSFGIGGTNVHLILEEAPEAISTDAANSWQNLNISAHDIDALSRIQEQLSIWIAENPNENPADLAYTWQHRKQLKWRHSITFTSLQDLQNKLNDPLQAPDILATAAAEHTRNVFLFPGQGTQYVGMAAQLYKEYLPFQTYIDECLAICDEMGSKEIRSILLSLNSESEHCLTQTAHVQLALFVVEYSLAKLLMHLGVKPDAMLGHSLGEYVAACVAGVFDLKDALYIVQQRARLMQSLPSGAMLAVSASEESIRDKKPNTIDLAAINSPNHCTYAGTESDINAFKALLENDGIQVKVLNTSHAFHSAMMEPMLEQFQALLESIQLNAPSIPYFSNVTGKLITVNEATSVEYYARHIRQPVLFADAVMELSNNKNTNFIEVGPATVLSNLLKQTVQTSTPTVSILRHAKENVTDLEYLMRGLGQLWKNGGSVAWEKFYTGQKRSKLRLPLYPFAKRSFGLGRGDVLSLLSNLDNGDSKAQPINRDTPVLHSYEWRAALTPDVRIEDGVMPCLALELDGGALSAVLSRIGGLRVLRVTQDKKYQDIDNRHIKLPFDSALSVRKMLAGLRKRDEVPEIIMVGVEFSKLANLTLLQQRISLLATMCNEEFGIKALSIFIVIQQDNRLNNIVRERLAAWRNQLQTAFVNIMFDIVELPAISKSEPVNTLAVKLGRLLHTQERGLYSDLSGSIVKQLTLVGVDNKHIKAINCKGKKFALLGPQHVNTQALADQIESATGASVSRIMLKHDINYRGSLKCQLEQLHKPLQDAQEAFFEKYGIGDLTATHKDVNDYCFSLLCEFLQHHTALKLNDVFTKASLIKELRIATPLVRYIDYFCHILLEEGFAKQDGTNLILTRDLSEAKSPATILASIQSATRLFDGQLRLLRHAFSKYPLALTGEMQSIEVLYPNGSNQFIRETYQDSIQQLEDELIMSLFEAVVKKILEGAQNIRILEVGGGYGLAMRRIIPLLANLNSVEFYFTDIGTTFLAEARDFAMEQGYDFMKFGVYDITKPANEQGFDNHSFDLIYAYNVVHATQSIREVAKSLESLLVDEGFLCLLERTNTRRYVDLVWGMADGWWHFNEKERDISPLMPLSKWQDLFDALNFKDTYCYPREPKLRDRIDMGIIVAQAGSRQPLTTLAPPVVDHQAFDQVFIVDTIHRFNHLECISLSNTVSEDIEYERYAEAIRQWRAAHKAENYCLLSDAIHYNAKVDSARFSSMDKLHQELEGSCSRVYLPLLGGVAKNIKDRTVYTDQANLNPLFAAISSEWPVVVLAPHALGFLQTDAPALTEASTKDVSVSVDNKIEIQTLLIIVMRQLFGIEEISGEDDFFLLGGDSLKVAQFTTELEKYGFELQPNEVFNFPKVSQLANYLNKKNHAAGIIIENGTELAKHLSTKLHLEVEEQTLCLDGVDQPIFYLSDTSLLNDRDIKRLIEEIRSLKLDAHIQPAYIFPLSLKTDDNLYLSQEKFDKKFNLHAISERACTDLIRSVQLQQRRLSFSIIAGEIEQKYAISPFQNMYLKSDNRVSLYQIEFDEILDRDLLNQAFTDVVRRQGLMRSSLQRSRIEKNHWVQHQLPNVLGIPTIDLSGFSDQSKNDVIEKLMEMEYQSDFDGENGIMYHLLLIRLRFNKSILLFNLDHSIFDNMSGQVLRRQLVDRYKALKSGTTASLPPIKSFKDYMDQLNLGPIGISPAELIELFDLRNYGTARNQVEKFIVANKQPKINRLQYTIDLSELNITDNEEAIFEKTVQLLGYSLASFLGIDKVPLKLIYQGRKYHDFSFFDTLGLFVDIVPLLLDINETPKAMINNVRKKLSYLNRYNLNFMNMVLKFSMLVKWRDVVGLTSPKKLAKKDPMLLLNYAGKAGKEYRKIIDFATSKMLDTPGKLDYGSFYVIATSDNDKLILDVLCSFEKDMGRYKTILDNVLPTLKTKIKVSEPLTATEM
ncbi:beta-ketoacyl synthase N-terminal-like domain-containing protein [Saccharophagus degradans]|uniref:type I polyketide synthase n=1 Tax=Saccharophagus degradans TaxID=86304 RepID=UPI002477FF1D|nr:type I polyketide synthase [Saccharophagus degradans]WGO96541.1 beta-ketoacyl synthase N-terminal-like domain-containing protein [Saccharophagus degradans]